MKIEVLLFAAAKDVFGTAKIELDLPANSTVADLQQELIQRKPATAETLSRCAFSIDQQYANLESVIQPNQEIAVIPPVSGG
jgi:molybdopterin converting factor subunit 1